MVRNILREAEGSKVRHFTRTVNNRRGLREKQGERSVDAHT